MLRNHELWAISIASGIRSVGFGATWPFMALFLNETLGIPIYVVGVVFTLGSVVSIAFSIIGGGLSDNIIGRKKTLLAGSAISGILFLSMGILLRADVSTAAIVVVFIFTSVGGSLVFPSANALVADVTTESERVNGYVVYRIMANLGWAIGPLSGSLIFPYGIFWIFILITICSTVQALLVLFTVRDRWLERRKRENIASREKMSFLAYDRYLLVFTGGTFFLTLVSSQFSVTLPIYAGLKIGLDSSLIGYIYAVNGAVVVLGQYPITNFMKRYPEIVSMILGAIAYSLGYFLVGVSGTLPELMLDMVVITIGENLVSPVMNSIVSKIAPQDKLARYLGFLGMVNSTGRALGPSVGAFFLTIYSFDGLRVWSSVDALGLAAVALFMFFPRFLRTRQKGTENEMQA